MHLLIRISDKEGLQTVVQNLKSNTALAIKSLDVGIAQVWARAFHDRALRKDEDIRQVARYIVLNPVRAGLVRRIGDYPYWDAVWL
jgi:REP element-mobilizing transposase RayT